MLTLEYVIKWYIGLFKFLCCFVPVAPPALVFGLIFGIVKFIVFHGNK